VSPAEPAPAPEGLSCSRFENQLLLFALLLSLCAATLFAEVVLVVLSWLLPWALLRLTVAFAFACELLLPWIGAGGGGMISGGDGGGGSGGEMLAATLRGRRGGGGGAKGGCAPGA